MSVPWEFFSSFHFISQFPPTRFPLITAIRMCHFLPVHHLGMAFLAGSKAKIQHLNVEIIKRIMSEKKTTLPSLMNQDWKAVKVETKKKIINSYLNEHHGIKRTNLCRRETDLCQNRRYPKEHEISVPLKNTIRYSKPEWEISLEAQIRNLRPQAKMLRQRENATIIWDEEENTTTNKTNNTTKVNKSEGKDKRMKTKDIETESNNTDKTGHSKTTKENSTSK